MKTDLERFKELFESVGIKLSEEQVGEFGNTSLTSEGAEDKNNLFNIGYNGFYYEFLFDANNKLIGTGAWE